MAGYWRRERVRLGWGRMSVELAGGGDPILLLHGLGGSGRYWAGLAPLLAGGHMLIAPDLAGFGRSDKPRIDYTRDLHAESLAELVDRLGIGERLSVVGHSMGGILAALFSGRHPQRVASLALVASPFPRQQLRPYRLPHGRARTTAYRVVQRLVPLVSPLVRSSTYPRAVIADYLRHTLDSYQQTSHALIWDPSVADELTTLDVRLRGRPQLLLFSDEDTTINPDSLGQWQAVLPGAEVLTIAGAHQLLLRDHFATLAGWLRRAAPPGDEVAVVSH